MVPASAMNRTSGDNPPRETANGGREIIQIRIKYLSAIRDQTNRRREDVQFPRGATLADVDIWVQNRHFLSILDRTIMATFNGKGWMQLPKRMETQLVDGDEIALFPVLSGG
jgi:molybdopterin converting factor small subunit